MRQSYLIVLILLLAIPVQASPILTTTGGIPSSGSPATLGWKFQTGSSALSVTALDARINTGYSSTQVRLYDSASTILGSATVSTTDPTETAGLTWNSHAVTPFTLSANTVYYIVEDIPQNMVDLVFTSTPSMGDGVTYLNGVSTHPTGGTPTGDSAGGALNPSYFGPNFDAIVVTPEPSSFFVAVLGMSILLRKRHK